MQKMYKCESIRVGSYFQNARMSLHELFTVIYFFEQGPTINLEGEVTYKTAVLLLQ